MGGGEDFCPIFLSNFIYLIISKVLLNCLWEVTGALVGSFQSAFIPGRQLADCNLSWGDYGILEAQDDQGLYVEG